jgi:hypothetical protein
MKAETQPKQKFALVETYPTRHETSTPDPDDRWDRASTHTDWRVSDMFSITSDKYGAVPINFVPKSGVANYIVYYIYSAGDSFGHDSQYGCEIHGIYETAQEAEKERKRLSEVTDHSVPWNGYFESLDLLEVRPVMWNGSDVGATGCK